jgi:DNA polymerase
LLSKPYSCVGCSLYEKGIGFATAVGPVEAPLLLVGEALGRDEAFKGVPFAGRAGGILDKALRLAGLDRADIRIHNVVNCQPTASNWLEGAPWERSAVQHCTSHYLSSTLQEPHKVIVALGGVSARYLLGLPRSSHVHVADLHGTLWKAILGGREVWVIPGHHPAYVGREMGLLGVLRHDLERASQIARYGDSIAEPWMEHWKHPPRLIVDPPVEWFSRWTSNYLAQCEQDPANAPWLGVDTETPDSRGQAEDELEPGEKKPILRANFSCSTEEGVTVPWSGAYIDLSKRLLLAPYPKVFSNAPFDLDEFLGYEISVAGPILDTMDMWHVIQSDTPRGLGFVSSIYSPIAWKHLADTEPGTYAAMDAVQTVRAAYGIAADLIRLKMWPVYARHVLLLDTCSLHPATAKGLLFDQPRLKKLAEHVGTEIERLRGEIGAGAPDSARPLEGPKGGLKKRPKDGEIVEVKRKETVLCCMECGEQEVQKRHKCATSVSSKKSQAESSTVTSGRMI